VHVQVYHALARGGVYLEGTLLKPQMMMAGVDCPHKPEPSQLAARTLEVLRRRVPPAVPGIMFLSGTGVALGKAWGESVWQ
jgi:fructose-bisphosphate aldolase class I